MEIEIIEAPIRFHLHGLSSAVQNSNFGEVGMKLMNALWKILKESNTANSGINHWVYLPDGQMFVGVALLQNGRTPEKLEPLIFELQRHLTHVHMGPYQALPAKWAALKAELADRGESICSPSLEIYGHHCDDLSKLETMILIGLQPRRSEDEVRHQVGGERQSHLPRQLAPHRLNEHEAKRDDDHRVTPLHGRICDSSSPASNSL